MSAIRVLGEDGEPRAEAQAGPALSILNALLSAGVGLRHDCGGKAICGTCALRIVSGGESLSPLAPPEAERLAAAGKSAAAGYRLACQAHAMRDIVVSIPAEGPGDGGEP
jgi:ferredoxin